MKKVKQFVDTLLAYVNSVLLIIMTALVLWQVFTRYVLKNPSTFTEELVIIILIWTSFLGAAYAFGTRQHMSLIFLKEKSSGIKKKILCVFIDLSVLIFTIFILVIGGQQITSGVAGMRTPILNIPKSYIYSSILVSGVLIILYQIYNIIEDLKMND